MSFNIILNSLRRQRSLQETAIETAKNNVYRYLHEIIEAFRNMDDILNETNQKNTQYQWLPLI